MECDYFLVGKVEESKKVLALYNCVHLHWGTSENSYVVCGIVALLLSQCKLLWSVPLHL